MSNQATQKSTIYSRQFKGFTSGPRTYVTVQDGRVTSVDVPPEAGIFQRLKENSLIGKEESFIDTLGFRKEN